MIISLEKIIRFCISSVTGERYVISHDKKKLMYIDPNTLYGHSMSQPLLYIEIEMDRNGNSEGIINTLDGSDFGYFHEVVLKYADEIKEKTKNFPYCPEKKYVLKINLVNI